MYNNTTATNGANNTVTLTNSTTSRTNQNQRLVDPFLIWLLSVENNLVCLRDKRTKQIYNVSYTEAGLMHTFTSKNGAPVYFNPDTTWYSTSTNNYFTPKFSGKKDKNPNVVVEKFIPMNHLDKNGVTLSRLQTAEFFMVSKAQRLVLPMNANSSTKSYSTLKEEYQKYLENTVS
jgi:hypothetical protein